jgi:hypothetical protein
MDAITALLHHRLKAIGLDPNNRTGFLRMLFRAITQSPGASLAAVNRRLQYLGWQDVELDYHTLQLAVAHFEVEGGCREDAMPCTW